MGISERCNREISDIIFILLAARLETGVFTCVSSALVKDWMALSKALCAPNCIAVIGAIELAFTCKTA